MFVVCIEITESSLANNHMHPSSYRLQQRDKKQQCGLFVFRVICEGDHDVNLKAMTATATTRLQQAIALCRATLPLTSCALVCNCTLFSHVKEVSCAA
jgi:hypothetical protein